jgi:ABC-2 type transport system permease protein
MASTRRALITKEIKLFSRDLTHTVQLGLLLGICFVYLSNFRVLTAPPSTSPLAAQWWHAFLLLGNVCLSSLVVTAICSRFVFPSVSSEGSALWILQSAPLSLRDVLRAKCKSWFVPVATMGVVVFSSGAMALNASGPLLLTTCIAAVLISYGSVSLAIGLGAVFSYFDWEHPQQIATSIGSFIYMVISLVCLIFNLIPLLLLLGSHVIASEAASTMEPHIGSIAGALALLFSFNILIGSWALSAGTRALERTRGEL